MAIVALTGGTGTLGGALLQQLLSAGHRVRALARPRADRQLPRIDGVDWLTGDLEDTAALAEMVEGADAILHSAYCPFDDHPPLGRTEAEHFVQTNIVGTLRLLALTPATRGRQLIYISSLAVYDPSAVGPPPHRVAVDETDAVWPPEFYGAHKAALEKMVIAGSGSAGWNTSVYRIGCLLGDYQNRDRDPLAATVAEAARFGELRTAKGAYVIAATDAAAAVVDAIDNPDVTGQVFNTFDRWLDMADLAPLLGELLGREIGVNCEPTPIPEPPLRRDRLPASRWTTDENLRRRLALLVAEANR